MRFINKAIFIFGLLFLSFVIVNNRGFSTTITPNIPLESNPRGIAINQLIDIASVVNEKSDSVSIVDLNTQAVLSIISVGKSPIAVAIDKGKNIALVSNSKDDTVSVIDLNTFSIIKTILVGKEPEGLAINQSTHTTFVTNHFDNTVSVIDMMNLSVIKTIPVGKGPKDISIDPELNLALAVNEKDYNVSVIDLKTYTVTGIILVGKKPQAIDINPETHLAAVANEKVNSITVIDLKTWQTSTIPVRKHPIDITINPLDNRALVICDEDRSLLLIDFTTQKIIKNYSLNKLPKGVAVNNFTNIAAVVDDKTDSITLIQLPNPIPEITSITPDNAQRGSSEITISIEGNKFIKTSTASIRLSTNDYGLTTVFIDNNHIHATVPKTMFSKAGIFPVTIVNPSPEGGTSNSINFTVNNPIPSITALEPTEAMAGTQSLTLNIYGTGFFDDTEVYFGGMKKPITYINCTKLQIGVTSEDLKTSGEYKIMVYNPSPGGGNSNKVIFTVKNPLEIKITSPLNGETINRAKVMVKGTFTSVTQDIGITVDGIITEIIGNEWVANSVPLTIGTNTITATIKDGSGSTSDTSITINTNETFQPVELSSNIASGIPPMAVSFLASTSFPPVSYQIDFEGDGGIDYSGTTFENIAHTYSIEGVFYPTIRVIDNQGNRDTDTIAITLLSKTEIDTLLKSKWERMKGAMANKDVENALSYFIDNSKDMYRYNFELMKEMIPEILQGMSAIVLDEVEDRIAKYHMSAVQDGIKYSFYVEFVKDSAGIWKIRFF